MWLMKINASHLVIKSGSHSSLANLARVADSTDIAGLIPHHIFGAKSISKQPTNTPLWSRSWADLQILITAFILTAKATASGRQTNRQPGRQAGRRAGRQVGRQTGRHERDRQTLGLTAKRSVWDTLHKGIEKWG